MMNYPIINRKLIMKNAETKMVQRSARKYYRKGHEKPLKNVLMKVVRPLPDSVDSNIIKLTDLTDTHAIDADTLIEKIRNSGLTGMSGNGFPVYQKLSTAAASTLLVNAVECDPGLIHDEWLVRTHLEEIKHGIDALCTAFRLNRSILAIKASQKNRPDTCSEKDGLTICHVPARYPAGEEHFLIQAALGITLPKTELPISHGILVMNVQTVWQIARILNGTFDCGRYITAVDIENGTARPVYVNSTTTIASVLKNTFGDRDSQSYLCYAGGGIMASHKILSEETFTEKTSFAAYLPLTWQKTLSNENSCKGCGACSRKCPAGIDVRRIVSLKEKDSHADISALHPEACLHCGSCTWFCHGNKIPEKYMD